MRTEKAHGGQSLWDMAIQYCGSADAAFDIARLNGLMPTARLKEGTYCKMPEPYNRKVAGYYAEQGEVPASWPNQMTVTDWIPGWYHLSTENDNLVLAEDGTSKIIIKV